MCAVENDCTVAGAETLRRRPAADTTDAESPPRVSVGTGERSACPKEPRETSGCEDCPVVGLCLPRRLGPADLRYFNDIVERPPPLARGDLVDSPRGNGKVVTVIRSGAFKTYRLNASGIEEVTGFHLPGDFLGLEAIGGSQRGDAARALVCGSVCHLPLDRLEFATRRLPALRAELMCAMSRQLCAGRVCRRALVRGTVSQRLALVLLRISHRLAELGQPGVRFRLPMPRRDLANFFGAAPETVSRIFRDLAEKRLISARGDEIQLRNRQALERLAGAGVRARRRDSGSMEGKRAGRPRGLHLR